MLLGAKREPVNPVAPFPGKITVPAVVRPTRSGLASPVTSPTAVRLETGFQPEPITTAAPKDPFA